MLAIIDNLRDDLERLRCLVLRQPDDLDPADPTNKLPDGKFTPRGVETCYRLFDQGLTRYAVSRAMEISFGAVTYRLGRWQEQGGKDRPRQPID